MPQFDPAWLLIVEERVSIGGAVPAILNFMRQVPEFAELNAPDFRYFITGGSPMPEALIKMYAAKNMQVVQGYAPTESCGGGVAAREDGLRKVGLGRMRHHVRRGSSAGDDGRSERGGRRGRYQVRLPTQGILESRDATRGAFDNGWFRTGDIGEIDDEGYLYIKDRTRT